MDAAKNINDILRATGDHHWTDTTIEKLLPEKQVRSDFKIGQLDRKTMCSWEKECQNGYISKSGAKSQVIAYCRERERCGFVYGDDFIYSEDLMPIAWMKVAMNTEKMCLMRNTDDDDRSITVMSRLVMWTNEIRMDWTHIFVW